LIAKNENGHKAIRELSSTAWYYSFTSRGMTRVPTQMNELEAIVKKYPNSLIATTACIGG
jgi:DNA polymerase-3 subunit alpha